MNIDRQTQAILREFSDAPPSPADALALPPLNRLLDIALAILLLIVIAPVLLIVGILVFALDPGPVFFAHRRIGRNAKPFYCLKFRSMATDAQERLQHLLATDPIARDWWHREQKLPNDPRITSIGHFLRRTSLDELPQLLNVIRGEMSLVGPRPVTQDEARHYGRYFEHYCRVTPGITGLWQISGRSETTYRERVALDILYVRRQSTTLYLAILVKTIPAVMLARGAQ